MTLPRLILALAGLILLAVLAYQLPPIHSRLSWRLDFAQTYLRGVVDPVQAMPTSLPQPRITTLHQPTSAQLAAKVEPTGSPAGTPTPGSLSTPTPTRTPLPGSVTLDPPKWEKQDINNCGPASLTMYLRFYGWDGDQKVIDQVVKPEPEDRNVNPDELVYFVMNKVGWLKAMYRVGGDLNLLKGVLAAGMPVIVEETFRFDQTYWPNDDKWAAHYLLLTGYDDAQQVFIGQDSFHGANQRVSYAQLDEYWQAFNRVYLLVYPPEKQEAIQSVLGANWDVDANRVQALETAQKEAQAQPQNAFAWFNVGTNQLYFERYNEAADAYDTARQVGLPQRMLRYQFGPFIAYFHSNRLDDLNSLTEYALQRTPNSEEDLLWHGWALYRQGKTNDAIDEFRKALKANFTYQDAKYALSFVGATP